jgi:hypothetical protein
MVYKEGDLILAQGSVLGLSPKGLCPILSRAL